MSALDNTVIRAEAGSGAVSLTVGGSGTNVGVGLGISLTINEIENITRALIDDSTIVSGGTLGLVADSNSDIDSLAFGIALGVSGGSGTAVSANGVGASAYNTVDNVIEASIGDSDTTDSNSVTAAGPASLSASDDAAITADAAAATLSVAVSGSNAAPSGSLGVGLSLNTIGNQTLAAIDGVDLTSSAGDVILDAASAADIDALAVAASVGLSGSGSAAVNLSANVSFAKNLVSNRVEALITGGSTVNTVGAVSLSARDDSFITADLVAASLSAAVGSSSSGGLSVNGAVAFNDIANVTRAVIDASTVSAGASLDLSAVSTSTIDAIGVAASASIAGSGSYALDGAGTGADVDNSIANLIEAGIVGDSSVNSGGAVTISALDDATISSTVVAAVASIAAGSSGSLSLTVAVSLADNLIDNSTRALIGDSSLSAGGALDITAQASADIDVTGVAAALSVAASGGSLSVGASVTVAEVANTVNGSVEALIVDADAAELQSVVANGPITISATNLNDIDALTGSVAATISATGGSVAIGGSVAVALARNTVATATSAGIRNSLVSNALGALDIDAKTSSTVDAVTFAAAVGASGSSSVAGSFSGAGAHAINEIGATTLATIDGGSNVDIAGDISIDASDTSALRRSVRTSSPRAYPSEPPARSH